MFNVCCLLVCLLTVLFLSKIRAFRLPHFFCRHTLYEEHVLKPVITDKKTEILIISKIAPSEGFANGFLWLENTFAVPPWMATLIWRKRKHGEALAVDTKRSAEKPPLADCSGLVKTCTGTFSARWRGYFHQRPTRHVTFGSLVKPTKMWPNMLHVW